VAKQASAVEKNNHDDWDTEQPKDDALQRSTPVWYLAQVRFEWLRGFVADQFRSMTAWAKFP
jgi:hypothetical protein